MLLFLNVNYENKLPAGLLESICYVESKYDVKAYHKHDGIGNSVGLCQIKLSSARMVGFRGTEKDLMKPENNVRFAARYLSHQLKRYSGSKAHAVIAYNQGSARHLTSTAYSRKVFSRLQDSYIAKGE